MATVPPSLPRNPGHWNGPDALNDLRKRVQGAIILELHTIPLYLFPLYSLKNPDSDAAKALREIVKQEMLHMVLAGNILRAIGGTPKLVGPEYVPVYPAKIFKEEYDLSLDRLSHDMIGRFRHLERPHGVNERPLVENERLFLLRDYETIGDFYRDLEKGLIDLEDECNSKVPMTSIFDNSDQAIQQQFSPEDGVWHGPGLKVIKGLANALTSLQLIVDQGEGGPTSSEGSHFHTFDELLKNPDEPDCHPVVANPRTQSYEGKPIHKVMLASDAMYTYLLMTIEAVWHCKSSDVRKKLCRNIGELMKIIKLLGRFLVTEPLEGNQNAAPPFNYYAFPSDELAYKDLGGRTQQAADAYTGSTALAEALERLKKVQDIYKMG